MKKIAIMIISIMCGLAMIYGAGVWYFQTHFLPGQIIQNIEVGLQEQTAAIAAIDAEIANQKVTIEAVDSQVEATLDQLGVQIQSQTLVEQTFEQQNAWLWPIQILEVEATETQEYQVETEKLTEALFALGITNPEGKIPTSNAGITKTETGFTLNDEVSGTLLNAEKASELVQAALIHGETTISVVEAQEQPTLSGAELEPIIDEANAMIQAQQTLTIREEKLVFEPSQLINWVGINEMNEIYVDDEAIWSYIESLVSDYTVMGSASTLNAATMQQNGGMSGSTIEVNQTTAALVNAIRSGATQTVSASMQTISSPTQIQGVGNTYVQISLTDQNLWYYQDGKMIIDQAVVTGDDTQGWGTITGVYSIQAKERNAVLEGYSYGWDYSVPVDYWMPIHSDGTGIHDASWHSTFGGSVYLGNGSHGCINLPPAVAEQLFNAVSVGTPVVIYK
ncbi:MAG: L,D-transpeptidase [Culicoidibacterales bacterium]